MKLYRGYKKKPMFPVPKLIQEWEELNRLKESCVAETKDIIKVIDKMGADKFTRWAELAQIVGPQFFTDQEVTAREFAGDKGFVVAFEADDKIVREHYQGEQVMMRGKEQRYVSNFVFSGQELGRHLDEWRFELIEIEREAKEKGHEKPEPEIRPEGGYKMR